MNKLFIYISILFCLSTFLSCNDEMEEEYIIQDTEMATRAVVAQDDVSISNPALLNNWENVDTICLNAIGTDHINKTVSTPWSKNGCSSSLSEDFRKDIKKEDGWTMLFHTFKKVGLDEKQNYMCFYNKFTGYIKVFYYYEGGNKNQRVQWYVKTSNGTNVKILDEPTYLAKLFAEPATNDMLIISNMSQSPTTGMEPGWSGFEFQVPRYCDDLKSMDFTIGAYDKTVTEYSFAGDIDLSTIGTITTKTKGTSKVINAIANVSGPVARSYVSKLGKSNNGKKVTIGSRILNLVSSIPTSGFGAVIKGGLNLMFGRTTTTSTSDVKLTTTGSVTLSGTSSVEQTADIPALSFNLYGTFNSTTETSNTIVKNNTQSMGHQLGVWTLKKNPVVYYDRMTIINVISKNPTAIAGKTSIKGETRIPQMIRYELDPIINPDILPYVKNYSVTAKFVVCDMIDGERYKTNVSDIYDNFNKRDTLYYDGVLLLKDVNDSYTETFNIYVDTPPANVNPTYFYDWGNIDRGRLLAVVTLDMTCVYNGKEKEYSLSQVYEVDYGIDDSLPSPETYQHPPYVRVVNYGYPYTGSYLGWIN